MLTGLTKLRVIYKINFYLRPSYHGPARARPSDMPSKMAVV